jgi:alkanesulfonate monooxygenase SsuD/methylene tetrahydromethanopterin reductase-like flavin-dependent oxidoreductase (luciferase family)
MIGSTGERMLGLVARYADSWNTTWLSDPASVAPLRSLVDATCETNDRDPATLSRSACVFLDLENAGGRWSWNEPIPLRPRDPEAAADYLRAYAKEGIDHAMIWLDPCTIGGIETFARTIELLDRG